MSRFSKDHSSDVSNRFSLWLVSNAKNKRAWLIVSFILLALTTALFSSPTRALAGKRLLREAWTTVASVTKLEKLAGITTPKSKSSAATNIMAVAAKNPILGTAKLNIARQGHAAITLSDGKILIVGGENANGLIKESEIYNPATRTFMVADSSITARTEPTATALSDGRILIAGGRGQAQALRTTEIYDYGRNVFTQGPALNRPRAGHSATRLTDGRILIAGGSADGSAEIFDPATQTFSLVSGRLNAARSLHGSVLLASGKALLAGGKLANGNALNSAEVFDPATQTFTAVGNMRGSRVRPLLNILRDGKVQVIGGDTSETMEMYNAGGQYFTAYAHLPNNDATMRTPGRAALFHRKAKKQASAQSLEFTTAAVRESIREEDAPPADPLDREGSTTSDTSGTTVTAGGTDSTDTTLSSAVVTEGSAATVTTDKTDYSPGEIVTISGSGWLAGEIVQLTLHRDNDTPDTILSSTVSQDGTFTNTDYLVMDDDLRVAFVLTAVGQTSGTVAQTTFTDAHSVTSVSPNNGTTAGGTVVTINGSGFNNSSAGTSYTYSVTFDTTTVPATRTSNNALTATTPAHAAGAVNVTVNQIPSVGVTTSATLVNGYTYTGTIATTASINAPAITYGSNGSVTVTVNASSTPTGNVSLSVDGGTATTQALSSGASTFTLSGLSAGSHTLSANYAAQGGFGASSASGSILVNQKALTGSVTADNKVYDGNTTAVIMTRTLSGVVGTDDVSLTGGTATFDTKNVGTGKTVTATGLSLAGTAANNYTVNTTATTTANITARSLTVSASASNKVYEGTTAASVTLSDNRVSGDTLTATSTSATFADKHVGTGKTVTVSGISISGADAGNYTVNAATTATADITVKPITVTAATDSKQYDGNTSSTGTPTIAPGLASGDTASFTQSFDSKNAGARTLTPTGSVTDSNGGNNYAITFATASGRITARPLIVTVTGVNKVYDGTIGATVSLSDNRISGDVFTASYTSASFANKNVGTGKVVSVSGISISGADAGNYTANANANTTADITSRVLAVSATGINKPYDGNANATVTLLDDRVAGDTLAVSYASASFNNKNVGTSKPVSVIGISNSGADAGNYTANTTASTTADITVATVSPVITANNKAYDGGNSATIASRSLTGVIGSDAVTLIGNAASFADKNVGTTKPVTATGLSLSGGDAGNYVLSSTSAITTADIIPLGITGSVTAASKTYDGTAVATILTQTLSGVIGGDMVSYVGGTASFSDKNVGTGKTVTATGLGLSGTDAGNYTVNSTALTTANITTRTLTITASTSNKVYDSTRAATVSLSDDRVSGDVITVSYASATFDNKNIGTGKTVTVSGISISGGDAGNYNLASVTATTTANITALAITGNITASNKVYDATTSATIATRTLTGVLGSDDVTYTGGTATFDNKNVGPSKTVTGTSLSLSGADAGNYTVNSTATTTADITALAITGSITASNKVYDGTTAATIATRTLSGVISGDTVSYIGGTATFADKHVGTGKTVTGTGLSLSGTDAGNYTVNATATSTANITKASLTITAVTHTKVYDGTTAAAATPMVTGLQPGDTVTGLSETYDNANVGTGKTLSVASYTVNDGNNNGGNYNITTAVNTNGVITAAGTAVTTVTVTPNSQQYSDKVNLSATTSSVPGIAGSVEFFINGTSALQSLGSVNVLANGTANLTGVALLETVAGAMTPGVHTVTAKFTPSNLLNYTVSSNTASLTINPEDARLNYTGMLFVNTTCATCSTATVLLSATVKDITAETVDSATDPNAGDISKATLTFVNRDTNTDIATVPISLVAASDTKVGTAVYNWNVNIGAGDSLDYTVGFRVNNYYTRNEGADNTVVTVSKPIGTNFITGGGYLVETAASAGQYAGAAGLKTNFGFNVKYNTSGKNLQGRVNVIVRAAGGKVYQIKGNQMDTLTVNNANLLARTAVYTGKANITDITNPLLPISLGGNLTFQMKLTDKGEPGNTDTMGITVYNGTGGLLFSSNWNGTTTIEQLLGGGNTVVR